VTPRGAWPLEPSTKKGNLFGFSFQYHFSGEDINHYFTPS